MCSLKPACSRSSSCFRCAATKSEANTYVGEDFAINTARFVAVVVKQNSGSAPSLQRNPGAFILWLDGALFRESGALAKDVSHLGSILISPILLYMRIRGEGKSSRFAEIRIKASEHNLAFPSLQECFFSLERT